LLRVQMVRILAVSARARCALALAATLSDGSERRGLLGAAARDARALEREGLAFTVPYALLLRAGLAAATGDDARARALLGGAGPGFDGVDMKLHAAAARLQGGLLVGGDEGRARAAAARAWLAEQSIKRPERMAAMLVPGFRDPR